MTSEIGGASTWVARTTSSEVSGSGGSSGSTVPASSASRRRPRASARPSPWPPARGGARGWRPCSVRAPERARRAGDAGTGGADHARDASARDQDQPGHEQEYREDVGPYRRDQVRGHPQLPLSDHPATRLERGRAPELRSGHRTRADAERSRREGERDRARQADRSGPQRPAGRPHLARQHQPAADHERGRNHVSERAEHEPHAGDRAVSERAAVPTAIGHASEQNPDRDQRRARGCRCGAARAERRQPQRSGGQPAASASRAWAAASFA